MNAVAIIVPLAGVAITALIAADLVFHAVVKRKEDKTDVYLHLHAAGEWWMFARNVVAGWHLSALGRALFVLGLSSGLGAIAVFGFTK